MSILINNAINAKLRSIAAAALAVGALVSVPAQAKELAVVKPSEIFAAYQVICLANPGDLDAQIAAAKAAPYNFTLAETSEDGSQRFDNPRMFAAMRKDAKNHFCMVGGRLAEGTSIDAASAAGASVLDKKGARVAATFSSTRTPRSSARASPARTAPSTPNRRIAYGTRWSAA
jgi:hypothetical protein